MDALDESFASLRHPEVRDLAWLLGAPALLAPGAYPIWDHARSTALYRSALPLLQRLDRDPAPLLQHLALRPVKRLGYYVENLLGFAFAHLPGWRVVAEHWAIREQQRTVGELDFLLQPPQSDSLLHLECAFKLFLLHRPDAGIRGFIGPSARDRLHLKLDKLFQQQLTLSQHPHVTSRLTQPIGQRLGWLKGWLFYPFGQPQAAISGLEPNHPHGWWQHLTPARQRLQHSQHYWMPLPRLRWVAPALFPAATTVFSGTQMCAWLDEYCLANDSARMLVELTPTANGWQELGRGFIVADDWPANSP